MIGAFYIVVVVMIFILLWARHFYFVRIKLSNYMKENYSHNWHKMLNDTSWYSPSWANLYYTKSVYDFIWRKDESFNEYSDDIFLRDIKKSIRRFAWELPLFFLFVFLLTLFLIISGLLK